MSAGIALGWAAAATAVPIKTKTAAAVLFNDDLRNCPSLVLPDLISISLKNSVCFQGQRFKEHGNKGWGAFDGPAPLFWFSKSCLFRVSVGSVLLVFQNSRALLKVAKKVP